jgi:hypothetical protein
VSKRVILHLGRPKTGTTAIQSFLRVNQPLLRDNDIDYLGNLAHLAAPYPDYARKIQAASAEEYVDAIRDMQNVIASSEKSILIYSNEIHYGSRKVLRAYKAAVGALPLTVILYFRRQDMDLQAQYMQGVVDAEVRETRRITDLERTNMDFLQLLTDYDSIFGHYDMVPRVYGGSSFFRKNIFEDFFFAAGLVFPASANYPDRSMSNISRGRLYIEILRLANQRRPKPSHAENMAKIDQFLGDNAFKSERSDYSFLSKAERNAIMEEFEEINSQVARQYFGRADGALFDPQPLMAEDEDQIWVENDAIEAEANRIYELLFKD